MADLVELDSLEILVIVDNELDPISPSPNPAVQQFGSLKDVAARTPLTSSTDRAGATHQIQMDHICCGAHGLSLMITAVRGSERRTLLFDTGPEEHVWERNASRLKAAVGDIELIQLSHWHRDHSGGILKALDMIIDAKSKSSKSQSDQNVIVDLHPDRPTFRGVRPPGMAPVSLEADPTFDEIENHKGRVQKNGQPHTVLDACFLVSGEIPRVTPFEHGLRFGVRYDDKSSQWIDDTMISDERFLMCNIKGKGLVLFTGCSHAGVVNASKHALELGRGLPLYAVMGGFHLADAEPTQIRETASVLKSLGTKVLIPGHCTGWRAKYEIEKHMAGCLVPSFVGSRYVL